MTHHDSLCTVFDQRPIDLAVGFVPFLDGEVVDRRAKMLIALVSAVTGEMLDRAGDATLLARPKIFSGEGEHRLRVGAIGAGVGDWVAEIIVDVDHGRKGVVRAHGECLIGADGTQNGTVFRVIGGSNHHLRADLGALKADAVAAGFQIGGDEGGNGAVALHLANALGKFRIVHGAAHDAADLDLTGELLDQRLVRAIQDQEEQLSDLVLLTHAGKGRLDPLDITVGKIERFLLKGFKLHFSLPFFCT